MLVNQSGRLISMCRKWLQCSFGHGPEISAGRDRRRFLYVAADMIDQIEPPFIDMHAANWIDKDEYEFAAGARRYENWESYVAGRVGLTRAVKYARHIGVDAIEERVTKLAATLREMLSNLPGLSVHDLGVRKCGIVTFQKQDESAAEISARLRQKAINVSVTDRLSARIDFAERGLDQLVRASVHYFNTVDEIERFVAAVKA